MPDNVITVPALSEALISKLAREVARNITPVADVMKNYGLSQEQFTAIVDSHIFQRRLVEEQAVWSASDPISADLRIKVKSRTMLEELLPDLYSDIQNPESSLNAKVEAIKMLAKLAGVGENANVTGNPDDARVRITINIGQNKVEFDKERAQLPDAGNDAQVIDVTPTSVS